MEYLVPVANGHKRSEGQCSNGDARERIADALAIGEH
jgi:hypothetical protein